MNIPGLPLSESIVPAPTIPEPLTLLKLILDEDRLAVLGMAAHKPSSVGEMAAHLPMKRAVLARAVSQLAAAGLLVAVADTVADDHYALDVQHIQSIKQTLFARPAEPTPETPDAQVVATFVRGGKMVQYPASPHKRIVLLHWLVECFVPDRTYREAEVNELLAGHSEDHATLRRYLVDHGLLARQNGLYRRVLGDRANITPLPDL